MTGYKSVKEAWMDLAHKEDVRIMEDFKRDLSTQEKMAKVIKCIYRKNNGLYSVICTHPDRPLSMNGDNRHCINLECPLIEFYS